MTTKEKDCEFCNSVSPKPIESDGGDCYLCKIIPMPSMNLKTGKLAGKADPPYYALKVTWDDDEYDPLEDFFPIEYCPKCGRKLNAI